MCIHNNRPTPFTTAIIFGWLVIGISFVVSAFIPSWGASLAIPYAVTWVEMLIGGMLTAGAIMALWSPFRSKVLISKQWKLDEVGMWLAAGGWSAYTAAAVITAPLSVLHWLTSATFAIAAVARIRAVRHERYVTERAVAKYVNEVP